MWVVAGPCSVACYKMLSHASAQRRAAIAGSRPSSSCLNSPYLFLPLQKGDNIRLRRSHEMVHISFLAVSATKGTCSMNVCYSLILMTPQQEKLGFFSSFGGKTLRPRRRLALGHWPGAEVGPEPRSVASKFTSCPTALPQKTNGVHGERTPGQRRCMNT